MHAIEGKTVGFEWHADWEHDDGHYMSGEFAVFVRPMKVLP